MLRILSGNRKTNPILRRTLQPGKSLLDPKIKAVGVFVNEDLKRIEEICDKKVIDIVQLHGLEEEKELNYLRSRIVQPVIKAFSIKTADDMENSLQSPADYILLDQGSGGTGKTFDWSLIPKIERPFFLAGGIGEENLEQALREIHPFAVDLSSSVETEKWKDPEKIRRVVDIVRNAVQD